MYLYLNKAFLIFLVLLIGSCSTRNVLAPSNTIKQRYTVKGKRYYPKNNYNYSRVGYASYYGIRDGFHTKTTANGETFNAYAMTAAHRTLPLPSVVRVTNLSNNKSVIVRVNDRGPFKHTRKRIIDVSEAVAKKLGFFSKGLAKVKVVCLPHRSLKAAKAYSYRKSYKSSCNKRFSNSKNSFFQKTKKKKQYRLRIIGGSRFKGKLYKSIKMIK